MYEKVFSSYLAWILPTAVMLVVLLAGSYLLDTAKTKHLELEQLSLQQTANMLAGILGSLDVFDKVNEASVEPSRRLKVDAIHDSPQLDGRDDDWGVAQITSFGIDHLLEIHFPYTDTSLQYDLRAAATRDFLYLHYRIRDDVIVYQQINGLSVHRNDHIQIAYRDKNGQFQRYVLATMQPGEVRALSVGVSGRALREEPAIRGVWLATEAGYNVEIQIPLDGLGRRFSTAVVDIDNREDREIKYVMGAANTNDMTNLGFLILSPTPLENLLSSLPFDRVQVFDNGGKLVSELSKVSDAEQTLSAVANINPAGSLVGRISIFQSVHMPEELTLLQQQLMWMWIAVLVLALSFSFLVRYRWLKRSAVIATWFDSLVDVRGRVVSVRGNDLMNDEQKTLGVGDLSRYESIVPSAPQEIGQSSEMITRTMARMSSYNDYLERMATRLNHELRTPVSVVRSSLDHLLSGEKTTEQSVYLDRAQLGVQRLTNILNKMAEARRLEDSLDEDEVKRFDLADLVKGCMNGYVTAFPNTVFSLSVEASEVPITGIPELIAQLLDKLIDNAVEFAESGEVKLRLTLEDAVAVIRIMNEGPLLALNDPEKLFESMVTLRSDASSAKPTDVSGKNHLGLGLYIAKIITDFHGGELGLANREDTVGVMSTLRIPLLRITSKLR